MVFYEGDRFHLCLRFASNILSAIQFRHAIAYSLRMCSTAVNAHRLLPARGLTKHRRVIVMSRP
jgi:hypothetical protein